MVFDTNVLFSGIGWRGTPFRFGTYQGIAIVTPADFLAAVSAAEPEA